MFASPHIHWSSSNMNNRYDSLSSVTLNGHTASEFERVNSILEDDVMLVETDVYSVGISWRTFRDDVI